MASIIKRGDGHRRDARPSPSAASLPAHAVGIILGDDFERAVARELIGARRLVHRQQILDRQHHIAALLEVVQGKADAFIYDQMSTYSNWKRNQETTRAILKPFQQESWAIGLRKDNTALKEEINRFLKDYRAKGGFEQLGDTWLLEQKQEFKRLGYPFFL